ncbi:MAG: hypothetical protein H6883_04205 [Rhodobiaceae bacterium]|nr:hypothetical protein [Rhodobiaceae bacterium]
MVTRMSISQFNSKMRQAQQQAKRAVDQYNREAKKFNLKVKQNVAKANQEINRYNSAVRAHNNRVRANRDRLRRELQKLASRQSSPRFVDYRATVNLVQTNYERLESHAEADGLVGRFDEILDLSEREAANNAGVMNALFGDTEQLPNQQNEEGQRELLDFLKSVSVDLVDRWRGAIFSLSPQNPDAARHFCTSAREVIAQILEIKAPDADVFSALPNSPTTQNGNPTRRAKISYFLHRKGLTDARLEDFVESDIEAVVRLFDVFNSGTHGAAGTFSHSQLVSIRKRVEDGMSFLSRIIQ